MDWRDRFKIPPIEQEVKEITWRLVKDAENPEGVTWSDENLLKVGIDPEQFPKVSKPTEKQLMKAVGLLATAKQLKGI